MEKQIHSFYKNATAADLNKARIATQPSGLYFGYEFLPTGDMNLILTHATEGEVFVETVNNDTPQETDPTGVIITKGGVLIFEDANVPIGAVANGGALPRYDTIYARHIYLTSNNQEEREQQLAYYIQQGVESEQPEKPNVPATADLEAIVLGWLYVPPGTLTLASPGVTYERAPQPDFAKNRSVYALIATKGNIFSDRINIFTKLNSFAQGTYRGATANQGLAEVELNADGNIFELQDPIADPISSIKFYDEGNVYEPADGTTILVLFTNDQELRGVGGNIDLGSFEIGNTDAYTVPSGAYASFRVKTVSAQKKYLLYNIGTEIGNQVINGLTSSNTFPVPAQPTNKNLFQQTIDTFQEISTLAPLTVVNASESDVTGTIEQIVRRIERGENDFEFDQYPSGTLKQLEQWLDLAVNLLLSKTFTLFAGTQDEVQVSGTQTQHFVSLLEAARRVNEFILSFSTFDTGNPDRRDYTGTLEALLILLFERTDTIQDYILPNYDFPQDVNLQPGQAASIQNICQMNTDKLQEIINNQTSVVTTYNFRVANLTPRNLNLAVGGSSDADLVLRENLGTGYTAEGSSDARVKPIIVDNRTGDYFVFGQAITGNTTFTVPQRGRFNSRRIVTTLTKANVGSNNTDLDLVVYLKRGNQYYPLDIQSMRLGPAGTYRLTGYTANNLLMSGGDELFIGLYNDGSNDWDGDTEAEGITMELIEFDNLSYTLSPPLTMGDTEGIALTTSVATSSWDSGGMDVDLTPVWADVLTQAVDEEYRVSGSNYIIGDNGEHSLSLDAINFTITNDGANPITDPTIDVQIIALGIDQREMIKQTVTLTISGTFGAGTTNTGNAGSLSELFDVYAGENVQVRFTSLSGVGSNTGQITLNTGLRLSAIKSS